MRYGCEHVYVTVLNTCHSCSLNYINSGCICVYVTDLWYKEDTECGGGTEEDAERLETVGDGLPLGQYQTNGDTDQTHHHNVIYTHSYKPMEIVGKYYSKCAWI